MMTFQITITILVVTLMLQQALTSSLRNCERECAPITTRNKSTINIVVILNKDVAVKALPVIYLAAQDLRQHGLTGPLQGWDVKIEYIDSEFSSTTASLEAMKLVNGCAADVFLGPVVKYAVASICRFSQRWGTPVLSPGGKPEAFNEHTHRYYEMLIRLNGYYTESAYAILNICTFCGWKRVGILYEQYENDGTTNSDCHDQMSVVHEIMKNNFTVKHKPFSHDELTLRLKELSNSTRIIFFCANTEESVIKVLTAAKDLGLTSSGDYVFFNVNLNETRMQEYQPWEGHTNITINDFKNTFTVTSSIPDSQPYREFSEKVKKALVNDDDCLKAKLAKLGLSLSNDSYHRGPIATSIASFYDGVMLYAQALNRTLMPPNECDKLRGNNSIIKEMTNGRFYSLVKKENITFLNNSMPTNYSVFNLNVTSGKYREVMVYSDKSGLIETEEKILWDGVDSDVIPKDTPECGFEGENCKSYTYEISIGILTFLVIAMTVCSLFAYRKYRLEKQIKSMSWKIIFSDIEPIAHGNTFGSIKSINSMELYYKQMFIYTGRYKEKIVAIKKLPPVKVSLTRPLLLELKTMKDLSSDHIVRMMGGCFEDVNNCIITEYCPRGSLLDVLENDELRFEDMMKFSLLHDIVKGLTHLSKSDIQIHGNLKSTNCLVDERFVLKLCDFGLLSLRRAEETTSQSAEVHARSTSKFWSAPEVLRKGFGVLSQDETRKADIYSAGIIINEVLSRRGTFPVSEMEQGITPGDIIEKIIQEDETAVFRPQISENVEKEMSELISNCWSEEPNDRPNLASVKSIIKNRNKRNESGNILDNLLDRMVYYSENLESLVTERTKDYLEEKKKCEEVLYQLLPKSVARQLIAGKPVLAKTYDAVTIYFSDIVGFTALSASSSPMEVVHMLNSLYSLFDETISPFDVYKVETIGDAYMVVSGLPVLNSNDHVREVARMALALLEAVTSFKIPHRPGESMRLRIGLHSGPCVAGVVGLKMPRYCLFGDTVNTASRMESNGLPMKIHMSQTTSDLLTQNFPSFQLQLRGEIEMKGKGLVTTYWLKSEIPAESQNYLNGQIIANERQSSPSGRGYLLSASTYETNTESHMPSSDAKTSEERQLYPGTQKGECKLNIDIQKVTFAHDLDSSIPLLSEPRDDAFV